MRKLKTFELIFKKVNNNWIYDNFVRSTEMKIVEQKDFFAYALTDEFLELVEKKINDILKEDNKAEMVIGRFVQIKDDAYVMEALGLAK